MIDKAIQIRLVEAYAKLDAKARKRGRFDAAAAQEAKDAAIARVGAAADPVWVKAALEAVVYICERRATFTADAVWWVLEYAGVECPDEPRALGFVMKIAERVGVCKATRQFEQTVRPSRHGTDVRVWRSTIYDRALDTEDFPH